MGCSLGHPPPLTHAKEIHCFHSKPDLPVVLLNMYLIIVVSVNNKNRLVRLWLTQCLQCPARPLKHAIGTGGGGEFDIRCLAQLDGFRPKPRR